MLVLSLKMNVIMVLMQKGLKAIQFFLSPGNLLRDVTIIKFVKLLQRPFQQFQLPTQSEHIGTINMSIPALLSQLQELRVISPHVKKFEIPVPARLP
jgi:hypothetical protein